MADSKLGIITSILNYHLDSWATTNGYNVAWEDLPFEPSMDESYLRQSLIPTTPESHLVGGLDFQRRQGVYQIEALTIGKNRKQVGDSIIASINEIFKTGAVLSYNSKNVRLTNVSDPVGMPDDGGSDSSGSPWYRTILSVYYRIEI